MNIGHTNALRAFLKLQIVHAKRISICTMNFKNHLLYFVHENDKFILKENQLGNQREF